MTEKCPECDAEMEKMYYTQKMFAPPSNKIREEFSRNECLKCGYVGDKMQ